MSAVEYKSVYEGCNPYQITNSLNNIAQAFPSSSSGVFEGLHQSAIQAYLSTYQVVPVLLDDTDVQNIQSFGLFCTDLRSPQGRGNVAWIVVPPETAQTEDKEGQAFYTYSGRFQSWFKLTAGNVSQGQILKAERINEANEEKLLLSKFGSKRFRDKESEALLSDILSGLLTEYLTSYYPSSWSSWEIAMLSPLLNGEGKFKLMIVSEATNLTYNWYARWESEWAILCESNKCSVDGGVTIRMSDLFDVPFRCEKNKKLKRIEIQGKDSFEQTMKKMVHSIVEAETRVQELLAEELSAFGGGVCKTLWNSRLGGISFQTSTSISPITQELKEAVKREATK